MFDFIEQPVTVRDKEYPMLQKSPAPVVMQGGLQPVAFVQEDFDKVQRPQSLIWSLFRQAKKKG